MIEAIASRTCNVHAESTQGKAALRVVPIVGLSHDEPAYQLLQGEALKAVKVTETSQSGSVPELQIVNSMDFRVYLMDGQELIGAKQNRILNTDVMVPAKTTLTIPVSCVESGRWGYNSPSFSPGKSASYSVRSGKHQRVHDSLMEHGMHDAGQGEVWNEVACSLRRAQTSSPSNALHDAYEARKKDLVEFRGTLKMSEQAVGLAVFHGSKFQGLDLFDRHATLQYFWESLLDSYAIDWLGAPVDPADATADQPAEGQFIKDTLTRVGAGNWERFRSPGEGSDFRLTDDSFTGSALVWEDRVLVHLQLFPKRADATSENSARQGRPRMVRRWSGLTLRDNPPGDAV